MSVPGGNRYDYEGQQQPCTKPYRPTIKHEYIPHDGGGKKFTHDGKPCRVVIRRHMISIGCSDVTPEAVRALLAEYEKLFALNDAVVIQP